MMNTHSKSKAISSKGCLSKKKKTKRLIPSFTLLPLAFAVAQVLANPHGGVVVGGQAAINQAPGVTVVDQASDRAVINWRGFDIDRGELTRFNQPDKGSIALNRVISKDPSKLRGQLQANGQVWLVNPNGILFGESAQVDVNGLVATTADISDKDFMSGRYNFSKASPNSEASVVNQGQISVGERGLAGLVAPHVRNSGVIQGKMGQVVIAGTPTFTVDFYGDGLIQFEATSKVTENANRSEPLVHNDGKISVEGGTVLITANAAAGIVDDVINMDGIVEAQSVGMSNGEIVLTGGEAGAVKVGGRLDASGKDKGTTGGSIDVVGEQVVILDGARVDASGVSGGGKVHLGSDLHGKGKSPTTKQSVVMAEAILTADAGDVGDGGEVIIRADDKTQIHGQIRARGGSISGKGGFIETSGKHVVVTGSADASAPNGKAGTWLIDPVDISIVEGFPPLYIMAADVVFDQSLVYAGVINNALNSGNNVIIDTSAADIDQSGDITQLLGATINKTNGPEVTLTLKAHNNIVLNDTIQADTTAGNNILNVTLNSDQDGLNGGAIVMNPGSAIISNGGDVILGGGVDPLNNPAVGTSAYVDGIILKGALISSGTGDISLMGEGYSTAVDTASGNASGIDLRSGEITLEGGSPVKYDTMIVSSGGSIRLKGVGGQIAAGEP